MRLSLVRRLPLSPGGLVVIVLSSVALRFGLARQDLIASLAGIWGLTIAGVSGAATILAVMRTGRDARRAGRAAADSPTIDGVEGCPLISGFELPRRTLPLATTPRWSWVDPVARVSVRRHGDALSEEARPSSRWLSEAVTRELRIDDLLGIWRWRLSVRTPSPVLILPDVGRLTAGELASYLASGDLIGHPYGRPRGDRIDFRTYTRSDPARLILWKVYARTRELMVRIPEPARTPDVRPLVFLVAGERDDAAAGVARLVMESGILGDGARFAADGSPDPTTELRDVHRALGLSRLHRARGGQDLEAALSHPEIADDDPVVLVCPAAEGVWIRPVLHQLARDPGRFVVLAAADAADRRPAPAWWQRLLWRPAPETDEPLRSSAAAMLRACRPLAGTGARVALIDRRRGQISHMGGDWGGIEAAEPRAELAG